MHIYIYTPYIPRGFLGGFDHWDVVFKICTTGFTNSRLDWMTRMRECKLYHHLPQVLKSAWEAWGIPIKSIPKLFASKMSKRPMALVPTADSNIHTMFLALTFLVGTTTHQHLIFNPYLILVYEPTVPIITSRSVGMRWPQ